MSNCLIKAQNITKSFSDRIIISDLSFSLDEKEIIAILGESGSGKSTLLNILGLLDNDFEGNLNVFGCKIKKYIDYSFLRQRNIGFVFQSYYLLNGMTVKDNILLPFFYTDTNVKLYKKEMESLTENLKINSLIDQKVDYLSGGEKQRVAIARALIKSPKLIICDEPTGNLDEKNTEIIMSNLKNEAAKGAGIIIVTHNESLAKLCDKIYLLKEGKLYEKN